MSASDAARHRVEVSVNAMYSAQHSTPGQLFYVYFIVIRNEGTLAARLLERHWVITDGGGLTREVHGEGVVGERPYLRPGEAFEYASGVPIAAPPGVMYGHYVFEDERGERFSAPIPPFDLPAPPGWAGGASTGRVLN